MVLQILEHTVLTVVLAMIPNHIWTARVNSLGTETLFATVSLAQKNVAYVFGMLILSIMNFLDH